MSIRAIRLLLAAGILLALAPARVQAASALVDEVQAHLNGGRSAAAVAAAGSRLATAPGDDEARFALGAVQLVVALERLGRQLHRYGMRGGDESSFAGMGGLPILRIPLPPNPHPEKLTYEALRDVLAGFVDDLAAAEATLAQVDAASVELSLNIGLIRLDLDGDGGASDQEVLWRILKTVADLPWLDETTSGALVIDFDASDVPWLAAYCHLLMAITEFPLAHDWRTAFETTLHGVFPEAGLPSAALNERPPAGTYSEFASLVDLAAFLHLNHWPVVAPERMRSVHAHLQAVPPLSRENWRRILAETDDANEWLPSPRQSGALPGLQVTQAQIDGWMLFLDEFEALLEGRKLLPHWRFEQGINLKRLFLEPTTFDLVLLIQGSAALPYLEDGELTTPDTWRRIVTLFGGDFFRYALWFN